MSRYTPIVAIAGLVVLELKALSLGINGVLFSAVIGAISGLGGYSLKQFIGGRDG